MRGALTQVYKHDAGESGELDISSLNGLNHTLTSSTIDSFASGNTNKWNYLRETNIGSLRAIENDQTGLDDPKMTPTISVLWSVQRTAMRWI